ncbi:MAG TPA: hypothetical protein VGD03_03570 [Frankiaceae bacterium]
MTVPVPPFCLPPSVLASFRRAFDRQVSELVPGMTRLAERLEAGCPPVEAAALAAGCLPHVEAGASLAEAAGEPALGRRLTGLDDQLSALVRIPTQRRAAETLEPALSALALLRSRTR